ncbi:hypothetical protein H2200_008233 [Cladophialophora chaetospira]|uniref:Mid2 domain-containing protein n=1 Tax=Cladophialophora chaetospira TaxID=386627 RepID=A0AA38X5V0_9EURO|nr:hypothetical protein H2200_008233 [Cladophialophora chaetospira]
MNRTGYRVVLSDAKSPGSKILARSGKFSIRQVASASSAGIIDPLTTAQALPTTAPIAATTTAKIFDSTLTTAPASAASVASAASPSADTSPENISASSSGTKTSQTGSSRTSSTAATTSTGFPKFVIPSEKGLSAGAKVGIAVSVSIFVLFIIGSALVFWRRRRPRHQADGAHWSDPATGHGMIAEYHGKPELIGDEACI